MNVLEKVVILKSSCELLLIKFHQKLHAISGVLNESPLLWSRLFPLILIRYAITILHNRINHLHEPALRIVYRDERSTFNELLEKNSSTEIHVRNLPFLMTETFTYKFVISPLIMSKNF